MFKRLFFLTIMMGAVGVPYVMTAGSSWWNSLAGQSTAGGDQKSVTPGGNATTWTNQPTGVGGTAPGMLAPPEGVTIGDLDEVLHFDGTPAWVMARWPRVSAGLAELDLHGYRVPLVTGTGAGDLAGSLTYYFGKDQRVSFITFHGTTGDPRKLIALVTSRYSLTPQKTEDPGLQLYQVKWNGKALSELLIRTAPVVRANQPRARYEVDLALKRP